MRIDRKDRGSKTVASPLSVYVWSARGGAHGFCLAGHLDLKEPGGSSNNVLASFEYASAYLKDPHAYALDPINLPLRPGAVSTEHAFVALGAIFDAAPDAWGRRVIHASQPNSSADGSTYTHAFLRGADGIGSLLLKPAQGSVSSAELESLVELSRSERPTLADLDRAGKAARELEGSADISEEHRHLLAGSWTIGGARPKAIIRNEGNFPVSEPLQGRSIIAKFPSLNESIDRASIEWASLRMAKDMGFEVPGHALARIGTGKALLLERFDRFELPPEQTPLQEGRRHYVSLNSLISSLPENKRLDTARDRILFSVGNLISIAARVSAKPSQSRAEMYARVLLNTSLHNTDDHTKNWGFIQDVSDRHMRIAPVFDVSPQGLNEHFLHLGQLGRKYNIRDLREHAGSLGIASNAAAEIEERVLTVLERRNQYFDEAEMPAQQRLVIERLIGEGTAGLLNLPATPTSKQQVSLSVSAPSA